MFFRSCAVAIALATALGAVAAPAAGGSPWTTRKFSYRADGKKLTEVLQDFAASQSVPVVIDAGIDGRVNGSFDVVPEEFLKALEKTHGLVWYFDGITLFIYPSKAMQSRVFRLHGYDKEQVQQMMKSLGLGDARFALRYNEAQQTLLAYGPPRHIELVSTVVEMLDQGQGERVDSSIRVVPLRFATAADRVSGHQTIPGLATTLNQTFSAGRGRSGGDAPSVREVLDGSSGGATNKRKAMERLYGYRAAEKSPERDGGRDRRDDRADERAPAEARTGGPDRPFFQADEGSNSIIVHGAPARMRQYEELIRQLDVPQDMVEIEATIIDVSSDEMSELGIDWQYNSRNGRGSVTVSPASGGTSGNLPFGTLVGSNITTVIADSGRTLLSRIRALEGQGKARIVSRPKVLGAVNRTASMSDKRMVSVRVAGNLDANLFSIEAGTAMQVLPQLQNLDGRRDVRMSLFIEDGNFEQQAVDQVPVVKRTEIRTEATVREGQSLLIGGIAVESESSDQSGVPLLSRIPLLGALFRQDRKTASRSERLFLLTPKVVGSGSAPELPPVSLPRSAPPVQAVPTQAVALVPAPLAAPAAAPVAQAASVPPADECSTRAAALGLDARQCAGATR